jgi:hypothetical protein
MPTRKQLHLQHKVARKASHSQTKWYVGIKDTTTRHFTKLKPALKYFDTLGEDINLAYLGERNTDQYLLELENGVVYQIDQGKKQPLRKLSARHIGRVENYKCWRKK